MFFRYLILNRTIIFGYHSLILMIAMEHSNGKSIVRIS